MKPGHRRRPRPGFLTAGAVTALLLPLAACSAGADVEEGPEADVAAEEAVGSGETLSAEEWRQAVRDVAAYDPDASCADLFPDEAIEQFAEFTGPGISRVEMIATDLAVTCNYEAFDGADDSQSVRVELNWEDAATCERLLSEDEDEYDAARDLHDAKVITDGSPNSRIVSGCHGDTRVQLQLGTLSESPAQGYIADDGFGPRIAADLRDTLSEWEPAVLEAHEAALTA